MKLFLKKNGIGKSVNLAKDNNVLHMIGYHKRSDPAMEYAKQVIERWQETGEFGKMRLVRITMPPGDSIARASGFINTDEPYPSGDTESPINYFDEATWKRYVEFVNYYIHQVNLMHFVFDEPYKVVFSDSSNVLFVAKSNSGICGTIEMAPYNTTVGWEESVFVGFEKRYVKVDLPAPLASQQGGSVTIMRIMEKAHQKVLNRYFLECQLCVTKQKTL